jgi:hypothetical protein
MTKYEKPYMTCVSFDTADNVNATIGSITDNSYNPIAVKSLVKSVSIKSLRN